jgi:hypothetical protein
MYFHLLFVSFIFYFFYFVYLITAILPKLPKIILKLRYYYNYITDKLRLLGGRRDKFLYST